MAKNSCISRKHQDIEEHSGNVSSLVVGKSSARLLATGGEDCKVKIWSFITSNCVMSLTGHTSPVECVQFNSSEERVMAGSRSGSLRLWDLGAAKILRTLNGHKANISCLDFNPMGEYLVSGSVDSNIKLWDVRRKGCVYRYKDHTQPVRCLSFSPDGKWLASASDDSTIKLWDLIAGKMITEFTSHTAAVTTVQFHPNEYLLASGSADRTVKIWDLEKFKMVGSSEILTAPVRSMLFSPDGSCLYSGSENILRVHGWEPDRCFDVVNVGWGKLADFSINNQQMIAVSTNQTNVSWYVVDLNQVKTSGSGMNPGHPIPDPSPAMGITLRRNYERPTTSCTGQEMKQSSEADRRSPDGERRSPSSEDEKDDKESSAEITNLEDYKEIFQPRSVISRTPPKHPEPFAVPLEHASFETVVKKPSTVVKIVTPGDRAGQLKAPVIASAPVQRVEPTVITSVASTVLPVATPVTAASRPVPSTTKPKSPSGIIFSTRNEPIGLNAKDFLSNCSARGMENKESIIQIRKGHDTMCVVLKSRKKNVDMLHSVWASGDVKTTMDAAVSMNDLSIVVDFLNIINLKPSLWKLDLCTSILPQIEELLQSNYEGYVQTGSVSLKLILKRFWPVISDTLNALPSVGVDISREERHQKCKVCFKLLKNINNVIKNPAEQVGRHGSTFKELQMLMVPLNS